MAFEWSYKYQNLSYQGKNQLNIDQGKENLVRLSEELELSSGVSVNRVKMTEKWCKIHPRKIGLSLS